MSIVQEAAHFQRQLNQHLSAHLALMSDPSYPDLFGKTTKLERMKWTISDYLDRVRDAWAVLTGRAEIYNGWDD